MKRLVLFISLLSGLGLYAQKIAVNPTITPTFFSPDQEITITYDVTGTALANLPDAWLWLWLPDLQNVDVPSNVNPASNDATKTNPAKFTKSEQDNKTLFSITLTLTEFSNKTADEIQKVGMLIKGNDWSDGQSEDYVHEIADGFSLLVTSPEVPFAFYKPGEVISIDAATSLNATITLKLDDEIITQVSDATQLQAEHQIIDDGAIHILEVLAVSGTETQSFSHSYTIEPQTVFATLPESVRDGINYDDNDLTKVTLVLTAPEKSNVFVIGDFNDWAINADFLMKKDGDKFWLTMDGLDPQFEYTYQYLIDGNIRIADPYSEKVSSEFDDDQIISEGRYPELKNYPKGKTKFGATFLQTGREDYIWEVPDFQKPDQEDLIIYELLVRDFTDDRTYNAVTEKLDYIKSLGVNAIELMPIMEYEGNISWGYNTAFHFAPDKFYGTEDDLRRLIDEAHKRGIAVLFDIVLNHAFGRNPMVRMEASGDYGPPTASNPWFNREPTHDYNVGFDFNHESPYTIEYVKRVVTYWTEAYNVDGYRFDLTKGHTQKVTIGDVGRWGRYDAARVATLTEMANDVWKQDSTTYVIFEHLSDNTEEEVLANHGIMLWGKLNDEYRSLSKGGTNDIGWGYYGSRGWSNPNLVTYMESHDEERVAWDLMKKPSSSFEHKINRLKLNATFFLMIPGPKMIWQFGEMGYDEELNNDRLGIKPTHWEYLNDPDRKALFNVYRSLIHLRTETDYLDDEYFSWKSTGTVKWMNFEHPDVQISVFGNFRDAIVTGNPHFVSSGTWYDYFTGEKIEVLDPEGMIELSPGEFHVYTSERIENYLDSDPIDFITGVNTDASEEVLIYPNPTSEWIKIVTTRKILSIELFDLAGQLIFKRPFEAANVNDPISLQTINPGIYTLRIVTDEHVFSERVIKN
ncbi:MAG: T9SS type A sorting domain-containing protein [Cyclobacteriaceae bacterium]